MIKAAEVSGNLQETFEGLSASTERDAALVSKVKGALIYPIILVCMAAGILVFLSVFALPKIANTFTSSGLSKPPAFSQLVFTVGLFLGSNIWWLLPFLAALIGLGLLRP